MRFKHRLLKEIYDQPKAINDTLEDCLGNIKSLIDQGPFPKKVVFLGMGSSYTSSLYAKYLFSELPEVDVDAVSASDQLYYPKPIDSKSLVIAVSQSGESIETVKVVKELRKKGVKIWSITNSAKSTLAEISDGTLLTHASEEKCSATKTFLSTLVLIYMFWVNAGVSAGHFSSNLVEKATGKIAKTSEIIQDNLDSWNALCQPLASKVNSARSMIVLGRGYNLCTALQSALVFKEISKVHAEAMNGGQYRHGPIELTDPKFLVISLATGITKHLMVKISRETRMLGGNAILISDGKEFAKESDILVDKIDEPLSPLLFAVPLELIAYHVAIIKGRNPDSGEYITKITRIE
jgi:glucosamine--fructose-6-phosphate aminotransferase (isomerizing)